MIKNHLSLQCKTLSIMCLAIGALAVVSCDDVYDGNETWSSDVRNTTLASPKAEDITYVASTDGSTVKISWPVVHGAGGYEVSLLDVTDSEHPVVVDSLNNKKIDGCSVTASRNEDTNYLFVIKTLGNDKLNNKDAEESTNSSYTTFTGSIATIPDGTDLATWFESNPVPEDTTGMLCYDLVAGGHYTLSKDIDFTTHQVTLRTTNKSNVATITYTGENSKIKTGTMMQLKYINVDASVSTQPVVELSSTPDESLKGATGKGDYYNIKGAIVFNGCNITGVNNNLFYDGSVKYCVETLFINNCKIHLTSSSATNVKGNAIIYFKSGYANTLQIKNSTLWNTGDADAKYFVQYNNSGRADRAGYTMQYVIFQNNTFYNIAKQGQWANYSGFNGQKYSNFTVTGNIWGDCGNKQIARRIMGGRGESSYPAGQVNFGNNTYMFNGEFESTNGVVESYDTSGTAIEEDPGFKDAANGDFTVSGATQLSKKTGDPRWLTNATE